MLGEIAEDDEEILDRAFHGAPLHFLRRCIIGSKDFEMSDLILQAVDNLLKQFIEFFPIKVFLCRVLSFRNFTGCIVIGENCMKNDDEIWVFQKEFSNNVIKICVR